MENEVYFNGWELGLQSYRKISEIRYCVGFPLVFYFSSSAEVV